MDLGGYENQSQPYISPRKEDFRNKSVHSASSNNQQYEEYDVETDPSMGTATREEEEYLDFLQEFGMVDFTLLDFLP